MKLKGIWITICLIIVAGVCATSYTKQYTSETVEMKSLEAAERIPQTTAGAAISPDSAAAPAAAAQASAAPAAAHAEGDASEARGAEQEETISRLMKADVAADEEVSPVMQDLVELDEQIAKSHTGDQDTTTNSLKAAAETERKLWDAQLAKFLDKLEQKLPAEEKDKLFSEQKDWLRERENEALAVSKKQSGGALQELEYNLSLKETTRARVYGLAVEYEEILSEAE